VSGAELVERLTGLVKLQADIIREQSAALEQARAVAELGGMIEEADRERRELIGEN
jgi:hypothetical protein